MTGFLPQAAVEDLRTFHFLIAVGLIDPTHVLFDLLPHRPAFGMPENHPRRFVLQVEQFEMPAKTAVVAFFRFCQHVQVGVLIILARPSRAIDALQLFIGLIAAPVGSGHLHKLEDLELAG